MYETFYRSAPNRYVTRARFIGIMRMIYSSQDNQLDSELLKQLNSLEHCFECGKDKVKQLEWRILLIRLKLLHEPRRPIEDHLKWGFMVLCSAVHLEIDEKSSISKDEMYNLFTFVTGNLEVASFVLDRVYDAQKLLPYELFSKSRVTYHAFCLVLQQPPVSEILQQASENTCFFIELMHPVVRDYIYTTVKQHTDLKKMQIFIDYYMNLRAHRAMNSWHEFVELRQNARAAAHQAFKALTTGKLECGMQRWRRITMCQVAALEIQRVVRGHFGREKANIQYDKRNAAISIQRRFRGHNFLAKYMKRMRMFSKHSITIQRVYRGRLGRIEGRKRLLEYYKEQMLEIRQERRLMLVKYQTRKAKGIQRVWRAYQVRKKEKLAEELRIAEIDVANELDALMRQAHREESTYKAQVTEFYDKLREQTLAKEERKKVDDREKAKVQQLRRRHEWDQIKAERALKKKAEEDEEQRHMEEWSDTWRKKIKYQTKMREQKTNAVLNHSDNKEDDKIRSALQRRINERVKIVTKGYKESGLDIASDLIRERARDEIVKEEIAEEAKKVEAEWQLAEKEYRAEKQKQADEKRVRIVSGVII